MSPNTLGGKRRSQAIAHALITLAVGASCGTHRATESPGDRGSTQHLSQAVATKYDWMQYGGDARHTDNNTLETQITAQNVSGLTKLFGVTLPSKADSSAAVLANVTVAGAAHDLVLVTTTAGHILALDSQTGSTLWSQQHGGNGPTMASPAVDPSRSFVYSYGLDGSVHKHNVSDGSEVTGGGWPELATLKPSVEKGGASLAIATAGTTSYLYVANGGYDGDAGDYQGHVTAINLATGVQNVFNADCSNQTVHFTLSSPDCSQRQSAVWAREGVMFDSDTGKIYFATGNGTFNPSGNNWGDTLLALSPDGTGVNGGPLDSYTPTNFQTLQNNDLDLGSSGPVILPATSKYPHLAVHVGKDQTIRIVNLDNLSGAGAPGHVAGEISSTALPQGGEVQNSTAVWTNAGDGSTWVFIVSPANGIAGLKVLVDGSGNPSLSPVWKTTGSAGSPLVAGGVLFYATNNQLNALNPTTGAQLWKGALPGGIHWQQPVVANGVAYIADESGAFTAFSLSGETPLSRTGWVGTASNTGGADVPAHALDGNTATRWSTGALMVSGMWFQVDMQAAQTFNEISMDSAGSANDFARGYQVFVSSDGVNFGSAVATGTGTSALITVQFPAQTARYVKVVQTGAASFWWSIAEFNVYTSNSGPPPPPPQPPSGLTATAASSSSINLAWTASPASDVTYSVFRSTSSTFTPSAGNQVAAGIAGLSYADTGLAASTTYYYVVEAVNAGGASGPSNENNATTQAGCGCTQINAGGPAVSPFVADVDFTAGSTINHANTIDLSGVTNPAPMAVYQTARIGNFTYTIPGFAAGASHTVRLHFAETYFSSSGSRVFNVSINGTQVLANFDIFAATAAKNKAIAEAFSANANSSGAYVIQFTSVVNNSLVSGIEIQ